MRRRIPLPREIFLDGVTKASPEAEERFFRGLRLMNGTCKTTSANRLDAVNRWVDRYLPDSEPLRILDAGASTGVTTVDWHDHLVAQGRTPSMLMADISVSAILRPTVFGDCLLDPGGHILAWTLAGRPRFRPDPRGTGFRSKVGRVIFRLMEAMLRHLGPAIDTGDVPVQLVSQRVRHCPAIGVWEGDLQAPPRDWTRRYDVIRAANFLNVAYFDTGTLTRILSGLVGALRLGGLLVLCRTDDQEQHAASLLRLGSDGTLDVVSRLGDGSEVESLALALPASTT